MGKQRRKRSKYHFSSKKDDSESEDQTQFNHEVDSDLNLTESHLNVTVSDDLFKNVRIDIDDLNKNLTEDDTKSVKSTKSISKSIKSLQRSLGGIHLKKNDKRTLRHNLFLKKLEQFSDVNNKQKKKQNSSLLTISEMDKHLPSVNMVFHKPSIKEKVQTQKSSSPLKPKGIIKAKTRKKDLLNNLNEFKKLLSKPNFRENALDVLTDTIEGKVFNEEM